MTEIPRPTFTWHISLGDLVRSIVFTCGIVYAAAVFTTKTSTNDELEKGTRASLISRLDNVEAKASTQDARIAVLDNSVVFIRESLARIERAVVK